MYRLLFALLILACTGFRVPPDEVTDKLIMKAAENQLGLFLSKIPPGHEADYGFTEKDDFENCEVAKPYRLLLFNNDFYTSDISDNASYLEIRNLWRVPVRVKGGDNKFLLTAEGSPTNPRITDMGGAGLAKELQEKSVGMDPQDAYYLLRVPLLSADFFVSEHENSFSDAKFIPLTSARNAIAALHKSKKIEFTLNEVQQMVKEAVNEQEKNMKKEPAKKKTAPKKKKKAPQKK